MAGAQALAATGCTSPLREVENLIEATKCDRNATAIIAFCC
jgi:hypothetical protein